MPETAIEIVGRGVVQTPLDIVTVPSYTFLLAGNVAAVNPATDVDIHEFMVLLHVVAQPIAI